jgi:hypothetical protein
MDRKVGFQVVARKNSFLFGDSNSSQLRRSYEKFVDCRQCATVMQREAVTVMPSCSGVSNVVVA